MIARAVAAAALVLTACAGSPPPPDTFHRLSVPPPAARTSPLLAGTLEVDRPSAVEALRQRPLAVADADGSLRHARYDLWADAPPVLVQHALVDHLRRAGVAERVVTPELRADPSWVVGGRLERFEWVEGGGVAFALELALRERASGELRAHGVYAVERSAGAGTAAAAAEALAGAAGEAFAAFLGDVERALAPPPAVAP